jgi:adenylosuccinate synthase
MPISVIVGGQFGSEGKGKVALALAEEMKAAIAIRVGGPNSGHTVHDHLGQPMVFRQLPTAAITSTTLCVIAAGSYVDPQLLRTEMEVANLPHNRLIIHPRALPITEADKANEELGGLRDRIGSTLSGTGSAVERRVRRTKDVVLAKDHPMLSAFVHPVDELLRERLDRGQRVVIEGTQGFGLSLLHGAEYPFVTSRDTTAAGFLSEAGMSPLDVDDIVLVLRAFPIRVPGSSGPLPREIDWATVTRESASPVPLLEYTSVTGRIRRIARFDADIVNRAIRANCPTRIVLNHVDYVDASLHNGDQLTQSGATFVLSVEEAIGRDINYVGTSPTKLIRKAEALHLSRRVG